MTLFIEILFSLEIVLLGVGMLLLATEPSSLYFYEKDSDDDGKGI